MIRFYNVAGQSLRDKKQAWMIFPVTLHTLISQPAGKREYNQNGAVSTNRVNGCGIDRPVCALSLYEIKIVAGKE
jgi:hypothetical protein